MIQYFTSPDFIPINISSVEIRCGKSFGKQTFKQKIRRYRTRNGVVFFSTVEKEPTFISLRAHPIGTPDAKNDEQIFKGQYLQRFHTLRIGLLTPLMLLDNAKRRVFQGVALVYLLVEVVSDVLWVVLGVAKIIRGVFKADISQVNSIGRSHKKANFTTFRKQLNGGRGREAQAEVIGWDDF